MHSFGDVVAWRVGQEFTVRGRRFTVRDTRSWTLMTGAGSKDVWRIPVWNERNQHVFVNVPVS